MSTAEESIPHGNQTAKAFTLTSALWFAFATTLGMLGAGYLIAPDFLANIEYLQFGRIRPMHVNAVLFGFVTPGLIAVAFFYLPRLLPRETPTIPAATVIFQNTAENTPSFSL